MTRVTVIDPDGDLLDVYRDLLTVLGFEVETFTDAMPGIEQLIASCPDLIVIDVELAPEREQLTGLQVVHSARSSTPLRDVPIVLCSSATERIAAALPAVMVRGDIHRLEKPFDLVTFERVVQTALGHQQARRMRRGLAGSLRVSSAKPADEADEPMTEDERQLLNVRTIRITLAAAIRSVGPEQADGCVARARQLLAHARAETTVPAALAEVDALETELDARHASPDVRKG